jgi:hypothetical protein
VALSVSSLLSTIADSKLQLGDCHPLKIPACWGAIHPTSKLVGFLAFLYKASRNGLLETKQHTELFLGQGRHCLQQY